MKGTPRKTLKFSEIRIRTLSTISLFVALIAVLSAPVNARALETNRSLFLSPELFGSTFVTDKGSLQSETSGDSLNVHTGDYNFLLLPSLNAGYRKAPWSLAVRYAYPIHFVKLNLPYGQSAEGYIRGTDFGGEIAYAFKETDRYRFYGVGALTFRFSGSSDLKIMKNGEKQASYSFEPDRKMRNYSVMAGAGYDFLTQDTFSYGVLLVFLYSSVDWTVAEGVDESEDPAIDRLEMTVYSLLAGVHARFDIPIK